MATSLISIRLRSLAACSGHERPRVAKYCGERDGRGKGAADGSNRATGFVITAASEIMAILALAKDRIDLRARLARIIVGSNRNGEACGLRSWARWGR